MPDPSAGHHLRSSRRLAQTGWPVCPLRSGHCRPRSDAVASCATYARWIGHHTISEFLHFGGSAKPGAAFFVGPGRKSTARAGFAAHADSPRTAAPVPQGLARAEPARAVRARGRGVRAVPAAAWDGAALPAGRAVVRSAKRDLARPAGQGGPLARPRGSDPAADDPHRARRGAREPRSDAKRATKPARVVPGLPPRARPGVASIAALDHVPAALCPRRPVPRSVPARAISGRRARRNPRPDL